MRIFTGMETPAQYHLTPPVLRPLNAEEHQSLAALLARAERAEARVKELQAELAEQEVAKLALIKESHAQKGERKEKNG